MSYNKYIYQKKEKQQYNLAVAVPGELKGRQGHLIEEVSEGTWWTIDHRNVDEG